MAALSFGGLPPPLGRLADGYRLHRFLLTGGLLVTAVALGAFALVSTPIAWCGLAFLQGCTRPCPQRHAKGHEALSEPQRAPGPRAASGQAFREDAAAAATIAANHCDAQLETPDTAPRAGPPGCAHSH